MRLILFANVLRSTSIFDKFSSPFQSDIQFKWQMTVVALDVTTMKSIQSSSLSSTFYRLVAFPYISKEVICAQLHCNSNARIYSWSWPKSHYYNMYVAKQHLYYKIYICGNRCVHRVYGVWCVCPCCMFDFLFVCSFVCLNSNNLFWHSWLLITSLLFKIDNRAIDIFYNVWTCVRYLCDVRWHINFIVLKTFCLLYVFRHMKNDEWWNRIPNAIDIIVKKGSRFSGFVELLNFCLLLLLSFWPLQLQDQPFAIWSSLLLENSCLLLTIKQTNKWMNEEGKKTRTN